jgi:ERCC4-type nuclease|tara:strand:+ start:2273 stop:2998 length:726 start_codon:yes stop_codon:yes gene_type:complete
MLPFIVPDVHEPSSIKLYLQKTLKVIVQPNEPQGLADYWWSAHGRILMWERKKARELLSVIGTKLDTQLLKYQTNHPDAGIGILQEGFITPHHSGKSQIWRRTKSRGKNPRIIYTPGPEVNVEYSAYRAYLYRREMEGFPVLVTADEWDTALTLSSMVYNSIKSSHEGLNRFVVTKTKQKTQRDIYIAQLMTHPGIGYKTAEKLIESYETPWKIYRMSFEALETFTTANVAESIFKDIGRL